MVNSPPVMQETQETWVRSLGWEDPLEKGKAAHSRNSGLENSMDCIVHGVTKRQTRLSRWDKQHIMLAVSNSALIQFSSVAQSCPTLRPHELQHTRPPCPSPTPGVDGLILRCAPS